MALPPPREGYHRDADPEGRWEGVDPDEDRSRPTVVTIVNWPMVFASVLIGAASLSLFIPFNILLWRWAL